MLGGEAVGLRCEEGLIAAIGPAVAPEAGDEVIDAAGRRWSPRSINGHTHAAMTLFRGYGDDLPLMRWLEERIWPLEAKLDGGRRLLGNAARLRRDDPHRDGAVLGHVLAGRGERPGGRATRGCGRRSARR